MENEKYCKLSYGELNLAYIDKIRLKDFYLKVIKICPDELLKDFLERALINIEREIESIKSIDYKMINDVNYISCK